MDMSKKKFDERAALIVVVNKVDIAVYVDVNVKAIVDTAVAGIMSKAGADDRFDEASAAMLTRGNYEFTAVDGDMITFWLAPAIVASPDLCRTNASLN